MPTVQNESMTSSARSNQSRSMIRCVVYLFKKVAVERYEENKKRCNLRTTSFPGSYGDIWKWNINPLGLVVWSEGSATKHGNICPSVRRSKGVENLK